MFVGFVLCVREIWFQGWSITVCGESTDALIVHWRCDTTSSDWFVIVEVECRTWTIYGTIVISGGSTWRNKIDGSSTNIVVRDHIYYETLQGANLFVKCPVNVLGSISTRRTPGDWCNHRINQIIKKLSIHRNKHFHISSTPEWYGSLKHLFHCYRIGGYYESTQFKVVIDKIRSDATKTYVGHWENSFNSASIQ